MRGRGFRGTRGVSANYLEQLAVEWYEYRGFFVRRGVAVGQREEGGPEAELGIVAVEPGAGRVVHLEASMDAHSWDQREQRYAKKFSAGARKLGYHPFPVPKAINSRPYGGRPRCMYGGACRSYGCPIHAKATTLSVSLPRAERTKKLDLRIEAMV